MIRVELDRSETQATGDREVYFVSTIEEAQDLILDYANYHEIEIDQVVVNTEIVEIEDIEAEEEREMDELVDEMEAREKAADAWYGRKPL